MTRLGAVLVAVIACGEPSAEIGEGPLRAEPGPSRYALVGEQIVLDGSRSTGAVEYQWSVGDGRPAARVSDPTARVAYAEPGRYQAVLTVFDADGNQHAQAAVISVTRPAVFSPSGSSTVAVVPNTPYVAAVSPDSDELVIVERTAGDGFAVLRRVDTCANPRTVTPFGDRLAVPCHDGDAVDLVPLAGGETARIPLPWGSRPYGAAVTGGALYVSLQGSGAIARIDGRGEVVILDAIIDARGIAAMPDGRLAVTRWRSAASGAEIALVDPAGGVPERVVFRLDPQRSSDTEIGGLPSYLNHIAVSPTALSAAVPSLQANIVDGVYRNGRPLRPDTTVRAIVSFVDLSSGAEVFELRKQYDDRGFASAAAYSSRGDYLYVAMPGNRAVARHDVLSDAQSGSIGDVGFAPDGVAVSADDRFLFVTAYMSRELVIYEMRSFDDGAPPVARLPLVSAEPLEPEVLLGKQLFSDAADPRLAANGYIACAHCHLEGESDNRVWDLTGRGEGLRNTISLRKRAGAADTPIHWSANFDEIQDFEHDIREVFGGTGLMSDAAFHSGARDTPLGDPKAGASPALDALARYVTSLPGPPRSPASPGGVLSEAALRGKAVFESPETGCADCHAGENLTDSRWLAPAVPLLHDVGTLTEASGQRLGGPLAGLDTPSLRGLSDSWPYLHDGSAPTLLDVLTGRNPGDAHGATSQLTADELGDLVEYLRSL